MAGRACRGVVLCGYVWGLGVGVQSDRVMCRGFGESLRVGAARSGAVGARMSGSGGRDPPPMGIV